MSASNATTWEAFTARYRDEWLSGLAAGSRSESLHALKRFRDTMHLHTLEDVTAGKLSDYLGRLRAEGLSEQTIASQRRRIMAALNWARSVDLLDDVPKVRKPHRAKQRRVMKGRPVTGEEFDRMLAAVPLVRPHDAETWRHYLRGLWLSGLRHGESLLLSWDEGSPLSVDLSGKRPVLRIEEGADKSGEARVLPLTPDFGEFLLAVPRQQRRGRVFKLRSKLTRRLMSIKRVCEVVAKIGRKAGVVVNGQGKCASAHDLRRSFGTRWARRVSQSVLQVLMRHASFETTAKYYVDISAEEIAEDLEAVLAHTAPIQNVVPSTNQSAGALS